MTVTEQLSDLFTHRKFEEIDQSVRHEMKRLTLDHLGVAISGSQSESGQIVSAFAVELAGPPESTVIGRKGRVAAVNAAFANAISSHSLELDDVDEEALFHYGPPIIAASLAAGERMHRSGKELIVGVTAGSEMLQRLSRSVNNALRDRGFHTTPTCGVFGATVAAGVLSGLSASQLVNALGLAGAQASGLMEMYGVSMQKRFNPGPAARNGVVSSLLAQRGFTGADSIIEGERGFAAAFAGSYNEARLLEALGEEIPVLVEYKPYSCARPIHNAIDCALELRAKGIRLSDLGDVVVYRHPDWARFHQIKRPRTYHEAQVSLPYSVALAFAEGKALPAQYHEAESGGNAEIMALSERIAIEEDASLLRGVSCHLVANLKDGRRVESTVDYPLGSIQRPLTDEALSEKFTSLCVPVIGEAKAKSLVDTVMHLEEVEDIETVMSGLGEEFGAQ